MSGTFGSRLRELQRKVGDGQLTGTVTVDQVYAQIQHEDQTYAHPRGGQAKYLEQPLVSGSSTHMQRIADRLLHEGPQAGMVDTVQAIARDVAVLAPLDENDLRRSAAEKVDDAGRTVHERPATVPRLTPEQLRAKSRRRGRR